MQGVFAITFPYRYVWGAAFSCARLAGAGSQGALCRVMARGAMNSALIEFEDGARAVVSRNALGRAVTPPARGVCDARDVVTRLRCRREVSDSNETR